MKLQFISGVDYGLLYFKKNDLKWEDTHFKIKKTKKIRIAVSLRSASYFDGGQSSLELILFSISDKYKYANNNNDSKSDNETPMITIHDQECNPSEQSDVVQLKMQITSLKEQLNTKQGKCVSLEKQNHLLRDERDKMQSQLHELMQQIEKYKQNESEDKKMEDNDSKLEVLEEYNIKGDLKCLEKQLSEFSVNYDNNKVDKIYDKSPGSLMVNDEINAVDLRLKSFGKYLMDIKLYINTLTYPDITKYKEWNLNEMLQWISLLDNGKYKQYVDVFRKGFESDGIQAVNLPDLDKNVLRGAPFNIVNFPDRKNLEEHFKSLVIENSEKEKIYNAEGSVTEYHT